MTKILFAINYKEAEDAIIKELNKTGSSDASRTSNNSEYYTVVGAVTYREAILTAIPANHPDILVFRETLGGGIDIVDLLSKVRFNWPDVRIILITRERKNDDSLLTTAASLGIYDIINKNQVNLSAITSHIRNPGSPQDVACYLPSLAAQEQKQSDLPEDQNKPVKGGLFGGIFGGKSNRENKQVFAGLPEKSSSIDVDLLRETIRAEERKKMQSEIESEVAKAVKQATEKTVAEAESLRAELAEAKDSIQHRQDLIDKLTVALGESNAKQEETKAALVKATSELETTKERSKKEISDLNSKHQSEIAGLEHKISDMEDNCAKAIAVADKQVEEKDVETKRLLAENDAKHTEDISSLQQKLDQKTNDFNTLRNTTNSKINSLQDRLKNAENAKIDLKAKIQAMSSDFESERAEMDRKLEVANQEKEKLESELLRLKETTANENNAVVSAELLDQIEILKKEVFDLESNRSQSESMIRKLQSELKDATAALKESQEESLVKDSRIQELSAKTDDAKVAELEREAQVRFAQAEALFSDANNEHGLAMKEREEAEELKREYEQKLSELEVAKKPEITTEQIQEKLNVAKRDFDSQLDIMRRGYEATIQSLQLKLSGVQSQLDAVTAASGAAGAYSFNPNAYQQPNDNPEFYREVSPVYTATAPEFITTAIAVAGTTQGVGTTTVAVNLAAHLAANGKNVILAEFNDFHPTINELFRLTRIPYGISAAMKASEAGDAKTLDRAIIKVNALKSISKNQTRVYRSMPDGFNIIPYSNSDLDMCFSDSGLPLRSDMISVLCQRLKMRKTYDYIIFDIRSGNAQTLSELLASGVFDQLVAVMANDMHSIGNAKSLLSSISAYGDPKMAEDAILVVNRYVAGGAYTEKDAKRIFGRDTDRIVLMADDVTNYGWAEKAGVPLVLSSKDVAAEIDNIVSRF